LKSQWSRLIFPPWPHANHAAGPKGSRN
jgi:hypothetical protein